MRPVFFDTNVVLYLLSADAHKADVAEALLARGGVVSVQVLNEATSVCRRKLKLPWPEVHGLLDAVKACCTVVPLSLAAHERALQLAERFQLSLYDALICASAQEVDAEVLYTEDLQGGLVLGGLQVRNPFV
ncbi:PIN domain-containing protein [Zoogloea sp.]|uniref:PIN domain-containing protein n=1 Tax=Zoogloea sp. TaxID=49181 RepID=UPI0025CE5B28|nr:PIN domain-containing protein [Zoogloea sp.]MCK6395223.1 PIN domain-containing protein [Zoogloea sp.]